jgi:hypothetical protein
MERTAKSIRWWLVFPNVHRILAFKNSAAESCGIGQDSLQTSRLLNRVELHVSVAVRLSVQECSNVRDELEHALSRLWAQGVGKKCLVIAPLHISADGVKCTLRLGKQHRRQELFRSHHVHAHEREPTFAFVLPVAYRSIHVHQQECGLAVETRQRAGEVHAFAYPDCIPEVQLHTTKIVPVGSK